LFQHGPFALIEKGTPIFLIILDDHDKRRMLTAAAEVHARGAHVIAVTDWEEAATDRHVHQVRREQPKSLLVFVFSFVCGSGNSRAGCGSALWNCGRGALSNHRVRAERVEGQQPGQAAQPGKERHSRLRGGTIKHED
jgi:hypothetical protein